MSNLIGAQESRCHDNDHVQSEFHVSQNTSTLVSIVTHPASSGTLKLDIADFV